MFSQRFGPTRFIISPDKKCNKRLRSGDGEENEPCQYDSYKKYARPFK